MTIWMRPGSSWRGFPGSSRPGCAGRRRRRQRLWVVTLVLAGEAGGGQDGAAGLRRRVRVGVGQPGHDWPRTIQWPIRARAAQSDHGRVTTWLNTPIQMQFRVIDGLTVRFAQSEGRDDHALLLTHGQKACWRSSRYGGGRRARAPSRDRPAQVRSFPQRRRRHRPHPSSAPISAPPPPCSPRLSIRGGCAAWSSAAAPRRSRCRWARG